MLRKDRAPLVLCLDPQGLPQDLSQMKNSDIIAKKDGAVPGCDSLAPRLCEGSVTMQTWMSCSGRRHRQPTTQFRTLLKGRRQTDPRSNRSRGPVIRNR